MNAHIAVRAQTHGRLRVGIGAALHTFCSLGIHTLALTHPCFFVVPSQKANKFEKVKVEKCGSRAWQDVFELSKLLKVGSCVLRPQRLAIAVATQPQPPPETDDALSREVCTGLADPPTHAPPPLPPFEQYLLSLPLGDSALLAHTDDGTR